MALKQQENFKGINAEYWKITSRVDSVLQNQTTVIISLYINKEIRDADITNILMGLNFTVDGINLSFQEVYEKIKLLPKFINSEDC